ncbi:DUF2752 domain-containing protein, partial [Seonamhaeicola marinus]
MEEYMLPCLNKKFFGVECFGCGMQRALALIFKGEFVQAFYMYPAIYTLILLVVLITINAFKNNKLLSKINTTLAVVNAIIIICSFI